MWVIRVFIHNIYITVTVHDYGFCAAKGSNILRYQINKNTLQIVHQVLHCLVPVSVLVKKKKKKKRV